MTKERHPPTALVQTWVKLIQSAESEEARERALKMLLDAFGDLKSAIDYVQKNNIQVS